MSPRVHTNKRDLFDRVPTTSSGEQIGAVAKRRRQKAKDSSFSVGYNVYVYIRGSPLSFFLFRATTIGGFPETACSRGDSSCVILRNAEVRAGVHDTRINPTKSKNLWRPSGPRHANIQRTNDWPRRTPFLSGGANLCSLRRN